MQLNDDDLQCSEMDLDRFVNSKQATGLAAVTNLKEAFERFDLNHDDRIDRREQVIMYRTIEKEIETEIRALSKAGRYSEARILQTNLSKLKTEFASLQIADMDNLHGQQGALLKTANKKAWNQLLVSHQENDRKISQACAERMEQLLHAQEIERIHLDMELSRLPTPAMKYSRKCLELMSSEQNLSRLKQFEEANSVRRIIDKLAPQEEAAFLQKFEAKKQARREELLQRQCEERKRLHEKLEETNFFHDFRKNIDTMRHTKKLENLERDMIHSHTMEKQRKPELAIKPSFLWHTRPNYGATSATLRGQHFLDKVKGKNAGEKIYVAPLTRMHDFDSEPLHGTITL